MNVTQKPVDKLDEKRAPAIEVLGLRKAFRNKGGQSGGLTQVLNGVDFSVAPGQIFALLGSNGAGKTTTIKILATLLAADAGTARVCGFDVARQPRQVRQAISLTGQFVAVDDILTGRENLVLIARLRHLRNARQEAERQLALFGLAEAADKPLSTYSGGMRRRLDLAMSMIGSPQVIFLDEPTTGLDPQGRLSVWKTVRQMSQAGVTVFLTTQYLEEADQLASQIAILHQGVIAAQGTGAELKQLAAQSTLEGAFLQIIGEDIGERIGQDIGQDTGQDIGQDTGQDTGEELP